MPCKVFSARYSWRNRSTSLNNIAGRRLMLRESSGDRVARSSVQWLAGGGRGPAQLPGWLQRAYPGQESNAEIVRRRERNVAGWTLTPGTAAPSSRPAARPELAEFVTRHRPTIPAWTAAASCSPRWLVHSLGRSPLARSRDETGLLDVAMNTQAARVERRYGRALMSSFHALFTA